MFFNISIFKVEGFSMHPILSNGSYVVAKKTDFKSTAKKIFVFKHKKYGRLIKQLVRIDSQNLCWFKGHQRQSLSTFEIGPVSKSDIIGEAFLSVSKKSIKLLI